MNEHITISRTKCEKCGSVENVDVVIYDCTEHENGWLSPVVIYLCENCERPPINPKYKKKIDLFNDTHNYYKKETK